VAAQGGGQVNPGADRRDVVLTAALETFVRMATARRLWRISPARRASPGPACTSCSSPSGSSSPPRSGAPSSRTCALPPALSATRSDPLPERLLQAFDTWTGRYLGAVGGELSAVAEAHRDVLGTAVVDAPRRFHALVTDAVVSTRAPQDRTTSEAIARTLISTAIGLKHQTTSRQTFRENLGTAIALLLR